MNKEIKKINNQLKTIKKLKGTIFLLESYIWKNQLTETARLEDKIKTLERQKFYIKKRIYNEERLKENPNYQPNNFHNQRDIEEIKAVPIKNVLDYYGIKVERNNFFKLRDEKTASVNFNEHKNVFYDHGSGGELAGSVIDLIIIKEKLSTGESIKFIVENFL